MWRNDISIAVIEMKTQSTLYINFKAKAKIFFIKFYSQQ